MYDEIIRLKKVKVTKWMLCIQLIHGLMSRIQEETDTDRTLQGGVVSSGEMWLVVADSDFYSSAQGKGGFGLFFPPNMN